MDNGAAAWVTILACVEECLMEKGSFSCTCGAWRAYYSRADGRAPLGAGSREHQQSRVRAGVAGKVAQVSRRHAWPRAQVGAQVGRRRYTRRPPLTWQ